MSDTNFKGVNEEVPDKIWTVENINEKKCYSYEEAITIAGNGWYNRQLLIILSVCLMSMLLDMFGYSVVVAGLSCDFQLTIAEKGILTSIPFAGAIIMAYPWGYISDTKGRKKTLLLAMSVSFIVSVISSFSPSWEIMAVLKLIGTSFSSSAHSTTYVLLGECTTLRYRGRYLFLMTSAIMLTPTVYYSLGYLILELDFTYALGFLNIYFRPWRFLALILAVPAGIGAVALHYFYESPKFLVNLGRNDEAVDILAKISVRNGVSSKVTDYPVKHIVLEEQNNVRNTETSLLKSIWKQTVPLFTKPLVNRTLQLFYIIAVLYSTNNAFIVWFPFVSNAIFSSPDSSNVTGYGFCELLTSMSYSTSNSSQSTNNTGNNENICISRLHAETVIGAVAHSIVYTLLNIVISRYSSRKKTILFMTFFASIFGGIATTLINDRIWAVVMFFVFIITAMGSGIVPAYFVELYPTSVRGMAACLCVMMARISSVSAINLVGLIIVDQCYATFYSWCAFVFTGAIVAWFLPSDQSLIKAQSK